MSLRTAAARACCVVAAIALAGPADPLCASEGCDAPRRTAGGLVPGAGGLQNPAAAAPAGLLLDRLSDSQRRVWRAIADVAAGSDAGGAPRSPTLRRLWEWARTTSHVLHVEMVEPSEVANGIAGKFVIERVDPTGRGHVAVVRLCPRNIRNGRVAPSPNGALQFIRFQGLTDVADRYAEVLAHELAHARHILESPGRVAGTVAAQRVRAEFLGRGEHSLDRIAPELRERLRAAWALLDEMEGQAEGVEAAVLGELVATGPPTAAAR